MTTPRGTYGGGYYASSSFPDTPIYDSLVAERGTPQIAPIRVPSPYDTGSSHLPALPALPALPSGPSSYTPQQGTYTGYLPNTQPAAYQPQPAPAPYIPQQATAPRGYPGGYPAQGPGPQQGVGPNGYEAVRPVVPRPVPPRQVPGGFGDDQYQYRRPYNGQGY
ncbi:DUF6643 family protein [Streptantibioticus ferralitis]|uniref:Uncharacterized protein n=1 Tax=Streptantibioticus ferralitis TaxID=236510 RepID=A0ABT5YXJ6_9ACTN|nr:DUF6643 family protein [Streptantibioticus ferralitis]MDF2256317.1 hypothetical protein [Streptantibioticus ferralitis]